jgi:lipoprotein-releasing system permease protein
MKFPFFISRRYLIAKKSHTAINLISGISIAGVTVGTMALVVILSVFNGFDSLVQSLFNSFDPDLKITPVAGKVFNADNTFIGKIKNLEGVYYVSAVLEENALLKYRNKQSVAAIKGVDSKYFKVTGLDTLIEEGRYNPDTNIFHYGLAGRGVASNLDIGVTLYDPLFVYVPKRTKEISLNPQEAFNSRYFYPTGIFSIDQEVDSKYVIVSLDFLRGLLDYHANEVSALEIKVKKGSDVSDLKKLISQQAGNVFLVQDRFQQQEIFYKIMKAEKWAIFFILSFILIVASFNIIGSLTMLIIDKKRDIVTLNSLGADWGKIRRIFLYEGWMISTLGALLGLLLGVIICWIQMKFKLVKLQGSGSFIIDHYPVIIKPEDIIYIFITVIVIGIITAWVPSRLVNRKHFNLLTR